MSKTWRGLDDLVPRLRKYVVAEVAGRGTAVADVLSRPELIAASQRIAAQGFGPAATEEYVGTANMAMLALLSNAQPPTWLVRPSAARVVSETDLHSIPTLPPRILREPGIIEARRPETGERLWGDVASLGWYSIGANYWIVGLQYPDGYMVARWDPRWTGDDLDEQLPALDPRALVPDDRRADYYDFAHQAARFLIVLALLAESDPSPLRIVLDKQETKKRSRKITDVFFDGHTDLPPKRADVQVPLLDGRVAEDVPVRGHLKRQRFGEGRAQTKWIYVQGFQSRRWLSPRWLVSEYGSGELA